MFKSRTLTLRLHPDLPQGTGNRTSVMNQEDQSTSIKAKQRAKIARIRDLLVRPRILIQQKVGLSFSMS
jgi:hypothetical protein